MEPKVLLRPIMRVLETRALAEKNRSCGLPTLCWVETFRIFGKPKPSVFVYCHLEAAGISPLCWMRPIFMALKDIRLVLCSRRVGTRQLTADSSWSFSCWNNDRSVFSRSLPSVEWLRCLKDVLSRRNKCLHQQKHERMRRCIEKASTCCIPKVEKICERHPTFLFLSCWCWSWVFT